VAVARYIKLEPVSLQNHPDLNERWVQARIAEDPAILGLGDIILKDKERIQPRAGRLDLLLQDPAADRRYEVEVQLGSTDESHIIRTIEYWDIERKRYPQYEHCAVLVAEDITSRFLNIIGLFNGAIPLVAIQMQAFQVNSDEVTLVFTTVVDELVRGPVDEDEEVQEVADRGYWEGRGTKATLATLDGVFEIVHRLDPALELKYNKFYVGLAQDGQPHNFVVCRPQKNALVLTIRLKQSPEVQARLDESGLEVLDYDKRAAGYRIRLGADDLKNRGDVLRQLIEMAFRNHTG
jgi:hypothetical protein